MLLIEIGVKPGPTHAGQILHLKFEKFFTTTSRTGRATPFHTNTTKWSYTVFSPSASRKADVLVCEACSFLFWSDLWVTTSGIVFPWSAAWCRLSASDSVRLCSANAPVGRNWLKADDNHEWRQSFKMEEFSMRGLCILRVAVDGSLTVYFACRRAPLQLLLLLLLDDLDNVTHHRKTEHYGIYRVAQNGTVFGSLFSW